MNVYSELVSAQLENLAAHPTNAVTGRAYYNTTDGMAYLYLVNTWKAIESVTNNYAAIVAPTDTDDSSAGYEVGSKWVDTVAEQIYFCVDATVGGAIWSTGGGTGIGGINYVANSDVANNIDGYNTTDAVNLTIALDDTGKLGGNNRSNTSLKISKTATDASGQYVYTDTFTLDPQDISSMMTPNFDGDFTDANYSDGDMVARLFSIDSAAQVGAEYEIPNKLGNFSPYDWQTLAQPNTQYQIRFYQASTNANAYDVYLKNILFGPQEAKVYGTPSTDWEAYTPTLTNCGNAVAGLSYRRVANSIEIKGSITIGTTTPTALMLFSLPEGLQADYSTFTGVLGGDGYERVGDASSYALDYKGTVIRHGSSPINFYIIGSDTFGGSTAGWNATIPDTWVAGGSINIELTVPIKGWSSNVVLSETTSNRQVYAEAYISSASTRTSLTFSVAAVLDFDVVVKDTHNKFTTGASCQYEIPEDGDYKFGIDFSLDVISSIAGTRQAQAAVRVGGLTKLIFRDYAKVTGSVVPSLTGQTGVLTGLTKGQVVDFVGYQNIGGTDVPIVTTTSFANKVTVEKVNTGSQTIAQSERIYAQGQNNAGLVLTHASQTPFTTPYIAANSHGALQSDGSFIMPVDGDLKVGFRGIILSGPSITVQTAVTFNHPSIAANTVSSQIDHAAMPYSGYTELSVTGTMMGLKKGEVVYADLYAYFGDFTSHSLRTGSGFNVVDYEVIQ